MVWGRKKSFTKKHFSNKMILSSEWAPWVLMSLTKTIGFLLVFPFFLLSVLSGALEGVGRSQCRVRALAHHV